jgi:hypothetical protein
MTTNNAELQSATRYTYKHHTYQSIASDNLTAYYDVILRKMYPNKKT